MQTNNKGLMDPNFKYIPSNQTNVQNTWRKYGWLPANEKK